MQLQDNQLYACFVSPHLCKQLRDMGITHHSPYKWKVRKSITQLYTNAFDTDDYYIDGNKHTDTVNPPEHVLPAYSIKDIEKIIPGYLLTSDALGYTIALDDLYNMPVVNARRLPDVFAELVIMMIKKRLVPIPKVNEAMIAGLP